MLLPWIALFLILAAAVGVLIYSLVQRVHSTRDDYRHWRDAQPR